MFEKQTGCNDNKGGKEMITVLTTNTDEDYNLEDVLLIICGETGFLIKCNSGITNEGANVLFKNYEEDTTKWELVDLEKEALETVYYDEHYNEIYIMNYETVAYIEDTEPYYTRKKQEQGQEDLERDLLRKERFI